jgi:hypothetical protein
MSLEQLLPAPRPRSEFGGNLCGWLDKRQSGLEGPTARVSSIGRISVKSIAGSLVFSEPLPSFLATLARARYFWSLWKWLT